MTATYNAEHFVLRTIKTALRQSLDGFEYLIVDDASSDRTAEVIAGVDDTRIRLIRQHENKGPSGARNAALGEARGEFIALLDHDDLWFEDRLEILVGQLESSPETGLVSSDMYVGDPSRPEEARTILSNPICSGLSIPDPRAWARGCGFSPSTAVVRRQLFDRHGLYDGSLYYAQDWEIGLRFWLRGETAAMLSEPLGWTLKREGQPSENVWGVFEERCSVLRGALALPDLPDGFRSAALAEIRSQETDAARVVLGEALDSAGRGSTRVVRREAIWAARYHLHGPERLKAIACAIWPGGAIALRRRRRRAEVTSSAPKPAPAPTGSTFGKPRDEFPADER